jgi:hypothetical protein
MQSLTYLGTADDVVRRYPWKEGCSIESINHQLIHSVIYDQKLAINDGYIVANPELISSLDNLNTSLLGNALLTGSVVLFSRAGPTDLAAGISKSALRVNTHKLALEGKHGKHLVGNLETLQKYVSQFSLKWPECNMGAIFGSTLGSLAGTSKLKDAIPEALMGDFEIIYKQFELDMNVNYSEARQHWEILCWRHFENIEIKDYDPFSEEVKRKRGYENVKVLMQVANEAYHMAYSCGLHSSIVTGINETQAYSIRPLTAFCPAHFDLFQTELLNEENNLQFNKLGNLLISVKPVYFKDNANYSWLDSLEKDRECRELRDQYTTHLDNYIHYRCSYDEAYRVTREYKFKIAELIANEASTVTDIVEVAVNFFGGHQILSAAKSINKLGKLLGVSEPTNTRTINSVKRVVDISEKIINAPKAMLESREIVRSLEREGVFMSEYGGDKQMAREFGLINAPLDAIKVSALLKPIKPWDPKVG